VLMITSPTVVLMSVLISVGACTTFGHCNGGVSRVVGEGAMSGVAWATIVARGVGVFGGVDAPPHAERMSTNTQK